MKITALCARLFITIWTLTIIINRFLFSWHSPLMCSLSLSLFVAVRLPKVSNKIKKYRLADSDNKIFENQKKKKKKFSRSLEFQLFSWRQFSFSLLAYVYSSCWRFFTATRKRNLCTFVRSLRRKIDWKIYCAPRECFRMQKTFSIDLSTRQFQSILLLLHRHWSKHGETVNWPTKTDKKLKWKCSHSENEKRK